MMLADLLGAFAKVWSDYRWKVGNYLDRLGCWLLVNAPAAGKLYAGLLVARPAAAGTLSGLTFAAEYFIERRWTALRRAALWDFALEQKLRAAQHPMVRRHDGRRDPRQRSEPLPLCQRIAIRN